jgi:DNA-directed RNA polymerase specialized sigma24 family protein
MSDLSNLARAIACLPGQEGGSPPPHLPPNPNLLRAISHLPEQLGTVVILFHTKEMSVKEISLSIGYSISTTRLFLHKGMHRLRMEFNEEYRGIVEGGCSRVG